MQLTNKLKREQIGPSLTPPPLRLPPLQLNSSPRTVRRGSRDNTARPQGEFSPYLRIEGPYLTFEMMKKLEEKARTMSGVEEEVADPKRIQFGCQV